MRDVFVAALCSAVVACGGSSPTAPTPTPAPAQTFTLTGTVTSAPSGAPLAATITVADGANAGKFAATSADGRYSIAGLQPGEFTIRATAAGHDTTNRRITLSADAIENMSLERARVSLSGSWRGTFSITIEGERRTVTSQATITQSGTAITVTYENSNGTSGTVAGQLSGPFDDATFSGTLALDAASDRPPERCHASAPITGTITPLDWRTPLLTFADCGGSARDVVLLWSR